MPINYAGRGERRLHSCSRFSDQDCKDAPKGSGYLFRTHLDDSRFDFAAYEMQSRLDGFPTCWRQ